MILVTPSFYKDFSCIAGACPDSCCQGWEVDADEASLEFYKALSPELEIKKRIDSVLSKDEFGNTIFTLANKKRCPFLNNENLCDMHIAIGGEHTPYTCRMFPRFINDFGGTREMGVSFSCPVVADMIYSLDEPMSFDSQLNELPPELNEIDAQTYFFLKKARDKAYSIVQNRDKHIAKRMLELIDYAVSLQSELEEYQEGDDDVSFYDVFRNPELINPEWTQKVDNACENKIENTAFNENIAMYFLYRYFLTAVFDYDVLSKVKMAAVGVLICAYIGADSWTMHLWSKETEHSQYNMDRYKRLLREAECLSASELKKRFAQ